MKAGLLRAMKKTTGIVVAAILISGLVVIPKEANAAGGVSDEVKFVEVTYDKFKTLIDSQEAPMYEENDSAYGYLFGGWYAQGNEETPIKSLDDATKNEAVYAKYVPAYVSGVKCQNDSQTSINGKTKMRVVSSIDSNKYSKVGVKIKKITLENGNCTKVKDVSNSKANAYSGGFAIYNTDGTEVAKYTPKQIFGAASKYFTAVRLINISDYDMLIYAQPYWVTLDGTEVEGLGRYVRVNDGLQGYVSIPINLKSATDVAAGFVSVDYSCLANEGFTLAAVEGGTVFADMDSKDDGQLVKCVGSVNDVSKDVKSDDIFVSLRFKVPAGYSRDYKEDTFYSLTIGTTEFTNIEETMLDGYSVWSVQY